MPTTTRERVKGRDLARKVARAPRLEPERAHRVTVRAEDEALAKVATLKGSMDVVGKRARDRGLTEDILRKILDERQAALGH